MNIKVDFVGGGSVDNGTNHVRRVVIKIDGTTKLTITHDHVYGLVINKIALDDGTDAIAVMPRTSNEIQIK